jgi:hypothetical protein
VDYEATMAYGAAQYADVLKALKDVGLDGSFVQTGGMCAALEIALDGGAIVLVTDRDDTLSWDRGRHEGWGVGLYGAGCEDSEATEYLESGDGSVQGLIDLLHDLLSTVVRGS